MDTLAVGEQLGRRARVDDAARVEDDDVRRNPADDLEVLLDEQNRALGADALERDRNLGDEHRREALGRLVDEQDHVLVQERATDREHLLLPARERSRPLPGTLEKLREELVHVGVPPGPPRTASSRFSATVSPANTSRSSGTYPTPRCTMR